MGNIAEPMVYDLLHKIRGLCEHPWKREPLFQDKVKWKKLWISLNIIGDTQKAIDYYLQLKDFDSNNGGYLYIFGLMQSMYIQQDAANSLNRALFQKEIDFKVEYPDLNAIREQRNNIAGHPTSRNNDKSFHLISRITIKKSGFLIMSEYADSNKQTLFKDIDLIKCIEIQKNIVSEILKNTMNKLKEEHDSHKRKFKGKRLVDIFPSSIDYHISKLYIEDASIIQLNFNTIRSIYEEVIIGIKERYNSLESIQDTFLLSQKIDYILKKVEKEIIDNRIKDKLQQLIILDSLKNYMDELKKTAIEIDNEFK